MSFQQFTLFTRFLNIKNNIIYIITFRKNKFNLTINKILTLKLPHVHDASLRLYRVYYTFIKLLYYFFPLNHDVALFCCGVRSVQKNCTEI